MTASADELVCSLSSRRHYEAAYGKWLSACARLADQATGDDKLLDQLCDAEEEAAAQFLALRPPLKWLIWRKF